jgi:hypothetical protein
MNPMTKMMISLNIGIANLSLKRTKISGFNVLEDFTRGTPILIFICDISLNSLIFPVMILAIYPSLKKSITDSMPQKLSTNKNQLAQTNSLSMKS